MRETCKEGWPVDATGKATSDAALRRSLTTNEDENPSLQTMLDFGRALERSGTDGTDGTDA
ncbi:MAG TPA: hypothetical protein VK509_05765, partial [Polyangiales bacterium]|nr:hypothetical protein [Polyangiales bacterium]